jgi:hypothetical protein
MAFGQEKVIAAKVAQLSYGKLSRHSFSQTQALICVKELQMSRIQYRYRIVHKKWAVTGFGVLQ